MKKKNLIKHYFALITMLFVVSGSFVSNVMAADVDYQVICSGTSVKLVPFSDEGNDVTLSNALANCAFCHLGEDGDFSTSSSLSKILTSESAILNNIYLSLTSKNTSYNFFAQAPPHLS